MRLFWISRFGFVSDFEIRISDFPHMRQVLFYIANVPVYGYGMMLFLAFVLCSWLAGRLARREQVDPKILPDLAIWLFVTGILGARITFVLQEWPSFFGEDRNPLRVFALWDGGLVLYG